ncbi:MAG: DegT/DnrJ/EryC1/StrS family aminotransferase, partial [Saprospiraceae bacterium]
REELLDYLNKKQIPVGIYYPLPLYRQNAFAKYYNGKPLAVTEALCEEVISLPIHTEMDDKLLNYISSSVKSFFQ